MVDFSKFGGWVKDHKIIVIGGVAGLFVFYYLYSKISTPAGNNTLAEEQALLAAGVPTATQVAAQGQADQLAAQMNSQQLASQQAGAVLAASNEQSSNALSLALANIAAQLTTSQTTTAAQLEALKTTTGAQLDALKTSTGVNSAAAVEIADINSASAAYLAYLASGVGGAQVGVGPTAFRQTDLNIHAPGS